MLKKYPHAVLVKDSALHYIGFNDREPEKVHLGTARNSLRITDKRVQQHFYNNFNAPKSYGHILCTENVRTYISENNNEIRLFELKALLYDLIRDRKKYTTQVFQNLLLKFRDCTVFTDFHFFELEENLINENKMHLLFQKEISKLVYEIEEFSYDRRFKKEWDLDWD